MERNSKLARKMSRMGTRAVYGQSILEVSETNENIFAISGDLGNSSGLDRFKKAYPERYLNIGIMEQQAVGFAAGLSSQGYNCFVSSFAPFLTMRACEQVRLNLGYMGANVKIVSIGSGVSMGLLGNSHFGLEDIGIIKLIPGIPVFAPADCLQVLETVHYLSTYEGPAYLRLTGKAPTNIVYNERTKVELGSIDTIREGDKILVLGYGTIVANAAEAIDRIDKKGAIQLINVYNPHPLPKELKEMLDKYDNILIIEEHRRTGGLASSVLEYTAENKKNKRIESITLPDTFVVSGSYEYILKKYKLDSESIEDQLNIMLRSC